MLLPILDWLNYPKRGASWNGVFFLLPKSKWLQTAKVVAGNRKKLTDSAKLKGTLNYGQGQLIQGHIKKSEKAATKVSIIILKVPH